MANAQIIDWTSIDNQICINPRMPESQRKIYIDALHKIEGFSGHIWMATSGSSGVFKWVALSKQALLISAQAANDHLGSTAEDVWLNPLPLFHVGGLGILARSFLSGARMEQFQPSSGKWDPAEFATCVEHVQASLTSLVPTQLYDIVSGKVAAPDSLRAVIVGGGALAENTYTQAISLGWKLLPSYGLTECSSQVATAVLGAWSQSGYPRLKPLKHVSLALDAKGYLKIKSPALLSAYAFIQEGETKLVDPKDSEGWLTSEDKATFEKGEIKSIQRDVAFIKIGGESVDLTRLDLILNDLRHKLGIKEDMSLCAVPDARLGHVIHLATTKIQKQPLDTLLGAFKGLVLPYENIRYVHFVEKIPRSPLGKLLRHELSEFCSRKNGGDAS